MTLNIGWADLEFFGSVDIKYRLIEPILNFDLIDIEFWLFGGSKGLFRTYFVLAAISLLLGPTSRYSLLVDHPTYDI